ncbi:hypothetical protein EDC94DRAFT_155063 [Helicostylum pulchrum]|nr:hypothetical protein EDC94DRAFT_155063 [Helicostylum pulchrum]
MVYSLFVNVKLIVVLAEFKPPKKTSATETDLVKLGRHMRTAYNDRVMPQASNPVFCGVLCEGYQMSAFIMDMISPKLYRLINLCEVDVFRYFIGKCARSERVAVFF